MNVTIGPIEHSPAFCANRGKDDNGAIVCQCWCVNCERGWHGHTSSHRVGYRNRADARWCIECQTYLDDKRTMPLGEEVWT